MQLLQPIELLERNNPGSCGEGGSPGSLKAVGCCLRSSTDKRGVKKVDHPLLRLLFPLRAGAAPRKCDTGRHEDYPPKSNARNRMPGANRTANAVSCIGLRGVSQEAHLSGLKLLARLNPPRQRVWLR
eukprot:2819131-Rhodomonas_salina.1